jgi:hypothetical protein
LKAGALRPATIEKYSESVGARAFAFFCWLTVYYGAVLRSAGTRYRASETDVVRHGS